MLTAALAGMATGYVVADRWLESRRYSFLNRVVIITGGSRGLGLVLARQLVAQKAHVVLLARNEAQLRRAEFELRSRGAVTLTLTCDVRERSQVNAAIDEVLRRFGRIDVLINNAGIIQVGPLDSMMVEDFQEAMAVHLYGAVHTTLAVLPHFRRAGGGRIVNIASIGGKMALPHLAPYCASKFALVGFSDALRAELRRENIFVTTVCPGLMRTGSVGNALFKGDHRAEHAWFAAADALPLLSISAERAAKKILLACQRRSARLIITLPAKAAVLFNELLPGASAVLADWANRALPEDSSPRSFTGWESASKDLPSVLARLDQKAAVHNNEVPSTWAL